MPTIFPFLQLEILEEEIAYLTFLCDRHNRWARATDDTELKRNHRAVADILKETIEANQKILENLRGE